MLPPENILAFWIMTNIKPDMLEILYTTANANDLDIVVSKTILGRDGKFIIKDSVYPVDEVYETTFIQQNIVPDLLKRETCLLFGIKFISVNL